MAFRKLGATPYSISTLGYGTLAARELDQTLPDALSLGVNWIDTATWFPISRSSNPNTSIEELLGTNLEEWTADASRRAGRQVDRPLIVTKIGLSDKDPGQVDLEIPTLRRMLERSRDRLRSTHLPLVLLQDPDHLLHQGLPASHYYTLIRETFEFLESEVRHHRIGWYGISCPGLIEQRDSEGFTSLEVLLEMAHAAGLAHFGVIQFPFNLLEPGALLWPHGTKGESLLELARDAGLGVLAYRPWKTMSQDCLTDPSFPVDLNLRLVPEEHALGLLAEQLNRLTELEAQLKQHGSWPELGRFAQAGHHLSRNRRRLWNWSRFKSFYQDYVIPNHRALQSMVPVRFALLSHWLATYSATLSETLSLFAQALYPEVAEHSLRRGALLDHLCPSLQVLPNLAQKALACSISVPGLHGIAAGCSSSAQWKEAVEAVSIPRPSINSITDLFAHFNQLQPLPSQSPSSLSSPLDIQ